jgi:PKD repeat protein
MSSRFFAALMFPWILRRLLPILALAFAGSALGQQTVTLQDGLNGYTGTTDATICACASGNTNYGAEDTFFVVDNHSAVVRFAIFASEGGPVPDGATIISATLSLYKFSSIDGVFKASRLLKNWNESQVTWNIAATGTSWTTAGALSAGNDVLATQDGEGPVGAGANWLNIDVTSGVQAFAGGTANYGWRIGQVSSSNPGGNKNFTASEHSSSTFRPQLTIVYSDGTTSCSSGAQRPYDGAPINGNPIAVSASATTTFEAEHFNCGGQDVAYHDNVAGNNGAAFRATEDVDIVASTDPAGGGYVIQNFYTGEWLTYTINIAQTGTYDLAIRTSADNPGSFHFEIDGVDVSGNVPVPNTGSLNNYVWVSKTGISLTAGQHVLKLVSDQQFFWVNQLRITPTGNPHVPPTASFTATPSSGSGPLTVTFNASGSNDNGSPITNLRLSFGDGTPDVNWTDKNVPQQHEYQSNGQYVATLTVTNAHGDSNPPATRQISVGADIAPVDSDPAGTLGSAVPTFHSMSLYYDTATPANCSTSNDSGCKVWMRYRKAIEPNSAWREGFPMWFDARTGGDDLPYVFPARGSAVHLKPGTKYYFEFGTGTSYDTADWQHHVAGTTWSETFPEDTVTTIPSQSAPFVITASMGGSASAYRVYDGCQTYQGSVCVAKSLVDRNGAGVITPPPASGSSTPYTPDASHGIVVKGSFVIVRNVRVKGAAMAGIHIAPGVTDVVIEDTEVWDWAHQPGNCCSGDPEPNPNAWGTWGWNEVGAIHVGGASSSSGGSGNSRIVIQRNIIKAPHLGSFPWDTGPDGCSATSNHPIGPNGISVSNADQQIVIRYNEISGDPADNTKWLQDGIGGKSNFSAKGSPGADSDIYQNIVMQAYDDGIEAEGGGRNVRIWGNYISDVVAGVAASVVHYGPHYAWRNVMNRGRKCHTIASTDNDDPDSAGFKYQGIRDGFGDGIRYVFNNTLLQENIGTVPDGAANGINSFGNGTVSLRHTIVRNNILHVRKSDDDDYISLRMGSAPVAGEFSHNIYNGYYESYLGAPPSDWKFGDPGDAPLSYKSGHGAGSVPQLGGNGIGNYQQSDTSFGRRKGTHVPNFTQYIDDVDSAANSGYAPSPAGECTGINDPGCPDTGAHQNGSATSMKFGISAGQQ